MTPAQQPAPGPLTKRIAANQPKPEPWKPAWLKRLPARDESGRSLVTIAGVRIPLRTLVADVLLAVVLVAALWAGLVLVIAVAP